MNLREKLYKRNRIYKGNQVNFSVDHIILPNKKIATREYMEHPGAVCIIPFIDKEHIIFVEQHRYPVGETIFEIPAGKLAKGENIVSCVKRELLEETGYYAKKVRKLFRFWPTPAFATEVLHIFYAKNLIKKQQALDEDEFLRPHIVRYKDAVKMVKNGKIRDSKTVIALLYYDQFIK